MYIHSTRLGKIEITETDKVSFPEGLPGFVDEKEFAVLPEGDSPFAFLQSLHEPDLTFLLVDPFAFYSEYTFELNDETVERLALKDTNPPQVWCIVTVPEQVRDMTANLLAPVLMNRKDNVARQHVIENSKYTTRHRLFVEPNSPEGGV
ncbi:flagellar assembly protein FliW [Anaerosporomusa subterranea]|uniref:Flagellar assembly factor FliW n=1 Tax=Anaerosporomusa subterranea TaxID=1794912 RepID=A0A154BRC0_ANASB|nr:flagellar assembly protein FliW [Anaerosporomusa subterranea]KYZ76486.1 flagellar assembly protein FliW [Anaerosporomusa subterranea]